MRHIQFTTNNTIDTKLFRTNLFKYLNKETSNLGQHTLTNPIATVAYNLKDGVGVQTYMQYSNASRDIPLKVQVNLTSDSVAVDVLYAKLLNIYDESKIKPI